MTPGEAKAVDYLHREIDAGRFKVALNERLFVARLVSRIERQDPGDLPKADANYLRAIAGKAGFRIEEPVEAGDAEPPAPEEGRAISEREGEGRPEGASPASPDEEEGRREAPLVRYDAARRALSEAKSIDEVKDIRDKSVAIRAYARQAEDPDLLTDAYEIQTRAERRLGELIDEAKASGHISKGTRGQLKGRDVSGGAKTEPPEKARTLDDLGITKKLSSRAQRLAKLPEEKFEAAIARMRSEVVSGKRRPSADVLKSAGGGGEFDGARATMAGRREAPDSLDYFPTAPWATRAWVEHVLPHVGFDLADLRELIAHDPACGEGHITGVLEEYFGTALGSDIFDYSLNGRSPPGWTGRQDFLAGSPIDCALHVPGAHFTSIAPDWIVTNSPFEEKALAFALRALDQAEIGVAMFHQIRWLETVERYEKLYLPHPPTLIAFFVERVNLCKGRWDPKGSTATAYMWVTWVKGMAPMPPFWIPPGRRDALWRKDDVARFTAQPCIGFGEPIPGQQEARSAGRATGTQERQIRDPSSGEIITVREAAE